MKTQLLKTYEELFVKHQQVIEKYNLHNRGFVFQHDDDEQDCELLFLGINPSYTEKHELQSENPTYKGHYTRNADRGYFKPFGLIHNELLDSQTSNYSNWTHIDLFVFRETNQKLVEQLMRDAEGASFLFDQLEIAKDRISTILPKVIVVSNALAREFTGINKKKINDQNVGVWMGYDFEFDEEFGSYRITNEPSLKDTHILFTSMLSGQRALDIGSRERLIWQVRRILSKS